MAHQQPGVVVTVEGAGGPQSTTTDGNGDYYVDGQSAGSHTVTISPPAGFRVEGSQARTFATTAAGEIRSGQDFTLVASGSATSASASVAPTVSPVASPTSRPSGPTTSASPLPSGAGSPRPTASASPSPDPTGSLPDTGGPSVLLLVLAAALVSGGAAVTWTSRRRVRRDGG